MESNGLAVAAIVALAAIGSTAVLTSLARPSGAELASFALRELTDAHDHHVGRPPGLAEVQAHLASTNLPLTSNLKLDVDALHRSNCRAVTMGGRRVFEICFQREGTWYHLYVGRRGDFAARTLDAHGLMKVKDGYAATAWADAGHVYALVTQAGAQALRRVI